MGGFRSGPGWAWVLVVLGCPGWGKHVFTQLRPYCSQPLIIYIGGLGSTGMGWAGLGWAGLSWDGLGWGRHSSFRDQPSFYLYMFRFSHPYLLLPSLLSSWLVCQVPLSISVMGNMRVSWTITWLVG